VSDILCVNMMSSGFCMSHRKFYTLSIVSKHLHNSRFDLGFLFIARGLGLERIFTNFLKVYCDAANLVLVLNTTQLDEVICVLT